MANWWKLRFRIADELSAISIHWHIYAILIIIGIAFYGLKSPRILIFPGVSIALIIAAIVLRRGFRNSHPGIVASGISHINDMYLLLNKNLGVSTAISRDQIKQIAFYKTDDITTDLICCEIEYQKDNQVERIVLHEEMEHFARFEEWLGKLPDFDTSWREKVVKSAFEQNYTIAFSLNTETKRS